MASNNLFGDKNMGMSFKWSGGNYAESRTEAALGLIDHVRTQMKSETFNGEITLVGHSHGGNVSIEAMNMMAGMKEFDNGQKIHYHNGWWHGNTSSYVTLKKDTVTIIALSNRFSKKPYGVVKLSALFGDYPYLLN
jgi:hypothetical protein